jgi:hypothetical protein
MKLHIAMTIKLKWNVNDVTMSCHDVINISNCGSRAQDVFCGLILLAPSKTILLLHTGPSVISCDTIHSHYRRFTLKLCIIETINFSNFILFLIEKNCGSVPSIYGGIVANVTFSYSFCVVQLIAVIKRNSGYLICLCLKHV